MKISFVKVIKIKIKSIASIRIKQKVIKRKKCVIVHYLTSVNKIYKETMM